MHDIDGLITKGKDIERLEKILELVSLNNTDESGIHASVSFSF